MRYCHFLFTVRRIQNQKNGKGKRKAIKRLDVGGRQQQKTSGDLRDFFSRQPISSKPKIEVITVLRISSIDVECGKSDAEYKRIINRS